MSVDDMMTVPVGKYVFGRAFVLWGQCPTLLGGFQSGQVNSHDHGDAQVRRGLPARARRRDLHRVVPSLDPAAVRGPGRWPKVIAEMDAMSRRRQGVLALQLHRRLFVEPPAAGERIVALQLSLVGEQAEPNCTSAGATWCSARVARTDQDAGRWHRDRRSDAPSPRPSSAIEQDIDHSVRYLASAGELASIAADTNWPKWHSPWWHMVLLHESGKPIGSPSESRSRW